MEDYLSELRSHFAPPRCHICIRRIPQPCQFFVSGMQPLMNSVHGHRYHEHQPGGQQGDYKGDTLSDFVSLVCQEANNSQGQVNEIFFYARRIFTLLERVLSWNHWS